MLDADCLFCKIIRGEIPCHKIYEDELFLAFLDINPAGEGHTLVVPKHHVAKIHDLPAQFSEKLLAVAATIVSRCGWDAYNVLVNNGSESGQAIAHVHMHLIPAPNTVSRHIKAVSPEGTPDHAALAALAAQMRARVAADAE